MENLWQRLKKHNVLRITAAYLMVGWVVMQIAEVMAPALKMPDWALSAIAFVLIFGLPIVILIAWSMDHKKKQTEITAADMPPARATGKLDYALFGGAALVLALVVGRWFLSPGAEIETADASRVELNDSDKASVGGDASLSTGEAFGDMLEQSIAVLPFADMSKNKDQEYFSDGITEEIINALNGIENLRVTGRTSSFAFKGRTEDLKSVSSVLKVRHVLEGSVRKQGDRVRIAAQLIEVESGFNLWSQIYDRPLKDVFIVQEEIARAITQKLEILLSEQENPKNSQPKSMNPEAIETYYQAKFLLSKPSPGNSAQAIALLEEAVELDPEFAQAWAAMASAHITSLMDGTGFQKKQAAAELKAMRALAISSKIAEAHAALGWIEVQRRNYDGMDKHFEKAMAINPDDPAALNWYSYGLLSVGKPREAVKNFQRAVEVDPVQPMHYFFLSTAHLMAGNLDEAEKFAKQAKAMGFLPANMPLADIAAVRGDGERAAQLAKQTIGMLTRDFSKNEIDVIVDAVFARTENRAAATELMVAKMKEPGGNNQIFFPNFFILLGEPELAFASFESEQFAFDQPFYVALWGPYGKIARQHPDFPEFAKRVGLVDYWQSHGWPELCEPLEQGESIKFNCS